MDRVRAHIRDIHDFPIEGIVFKDITPVMKDPEALKVAIDGLCRPFQDEHLTAVAGMEARGFIFGSLVAYQLGVGFIPLRKPGKLPYDVKSKSYELEYGRATLEVHTDAVEPGQRILVIDDLLATGGTALASCELLEELGANIVSCAFMIELEALGGRQKLGGRPVHSLLTY
jgi:adenine phosphoribosyltransferase